MRGSEVNWLAEKFPAALAPVLLRLFQCIWLLIPAPRNMGHRLFKMSLFIQANVSRPRRDIFPRPSQF